MLYQGTNTLADNCRNMMVHHCRGLSYSFPYHMERWKDPSSTLSESSCGMRNIMLLNVAIFAMFAHFSSKMGQGDCGMNKMAPHCCTGVLYSFPYHIERWQCPASSLTELPSGVWTICYPPSHHYTALVISAHWWVKTTVIEIWWYLIAADVFHTSFHILWKDGKIQHWLYLSFLDGCRP